ncbi:MAG: translation initiation factor IF-3, partial [Alphaproteobacteria bacterium]
RPGTDEHDLERQLKKAQEFLGEGQRVKFTLRFRGREMAHQQLGREKLLRVAEQLSDISWIEIEPRTEGRVMHLVLAPGARKAKVAPGAPVPAVSPARTGAVAGAAPAAAPRPATTAASSPKPEAPPAG